MSEPARRIDPVRATRTALTLTVVALVFVLTPGMTNSYTLYLATLGVIYSIVSTGMILLLGDANQLSMAGGAFFAIGAYGTEIGVQHWGLTWAQAVIVAVVIAGVVGALLALPAMRLEHIYLAVATLGFVLVVQQIINAERDYTGGAVGMGTEAKPGLFGISFESPAAFFRVSLVLLVVVLVVGRNLKRSRWGRAMRAMRDSPAGSRAAGIRVEYVKLAVFILSSMFIALAGALYANLVGYLSPTRFGLFLSIEFVIMAVIGGPEVLVLGAVLGGVFVAWMPEVMREFGGAQIFMYGAIMVVVAVWAPKGLGGLLLSGFRRFRRFRRRNMNPESLVTNLSLESEVGSSDRDVVVAHGDSNV